MSEGKIQAKLLETLLYMSRIMRKSSWFPSRLRKPSRFLSRSDTNLAVQPQKMARGLKLPIYKVHVEGLYYVCSENKDADQLIIKQVIS